MRPQRGGAEVSSFLRKVGRRKKSKVLGEVEVMDREQYQDLDLDAKVALIQKLIPLGLMHVAEVLEQEVEALAGGWYERKGGETAGVRYGSNDGSVRLGGQRMRVKVPRVRGDRGEIPLRSYAALKRERGEVDDLLLKRVLYGLSCRNYEAAAESVPVAVVCRSERSQAAGVPRSRPQQRAVLGALCRWQVVCRLDDGGFAGSDAGWREALSGLR